MFAQKCENFEIVGFNSQGVCRQCQHAKLGMSAKFELALKLQQFLTGFWSSSRRAEEPLIRQNITVSPHAILCLQDHLQLAIYTEDMCACAVIASQKLRICVQKCKAAGIDCRLSMTARFLHSWLFRTVLESLFFFPSFFCALFFSIYWTAWRVSCLAFVRVCFLSNSQVSLGTALSAERMLSSGSLTWNSLIADAPHSLPSVSTKAAVTTQHGNGEVYC